MVSYCNLSFEYELAARSAFRLTPSLQRLEERWSDILNLVPPRERQGDFLCWGVTPRTVALAAERSLSLPSPEVVREVNDKRFSHALEQRLGIVLPGSEVVDSEVTLQRALTACEHDWVLKHPFGVSGRERVTGKSGVLTTAASRWASARFKEGWTLLFEPWCYDKNEVSLHFRIGDEVEYLGHCRLITDESGAFRGNRVRPGETLSPAFTEPALQTAEMVAGAGYRGPLSVDAFSGRLGEKAVARPLTEINARYTFGRLTLCLARRLPSDWSLFWYHPKPKRALELAPAARSFEEAGAAAGLFRLPSDCDPRGSSGTYLMAARREEELEHILRIWLGITF